jgi:hypothetical protein
VVEGQVREHHVAGGALDERAGRGLAVLADDEVTLPVPWDGAVGGLGGPATGQHQRNGAGPALAGLAVWPAAGVSRPQSLGEFAAEFSARIRSSSRRYLVRPDALEAEASERIGGFGFPLGGECQPLRHLLPVRGLIPTIRPAPLLP